jgi:LysR family transcriptional regulator (chromosome initiation inhibitor)
MLDYAALKAVAAVVETGSFDKAAARLNVTPSAISQRVKQLEERMGTVLVVRGQPCIATEKGEWLCRHMEHVGMLERELFNHLPALAENAVDDLPVTLPIAVNADSLGTWFLKAIADFAGNSNYMLHVAVDDQEHTADWLRQGRVTGAVTALGAAVRGCKVENLGSLRYHATASPDFVARYFPDGVTLHSLARAPALTFNQKDQLQSEWIRQNFGRGTQSPTHWLPSTHAFVDGSLAGMGWGMNPINLVHDHLRSGRLMELVPGTPLDIPLFWQINRLTADRLSGLTRAILAVAKQELVPDVSNRR